MTWEGLDEARLEDVGRARGRGRCSACPCRHRIGVGSRRVGDESLGSVLVAEKVKDEFVQRGHLQRLSRLSESSSPDSFGDLVATVWSIASPGHGVGTPA